MRVVWITHNYPRHDGDLSGAFLHPLAVALRQRGVDVRVIAPSDGGRGGTDDIDGVPIQRVRYAAPRDERYAYRGTMSDAIWSPRGILMLARLRRALRTAAVAELRGAPAAHLVHAHWWIPGGLSVPAQVPFVLTCHGTDLRLLDRFPLAAPIARPVFRRARVVTTVSRPLAEVVRRRTGVTVAEDAIQPMPVKDLDRPWSDRAGAIVVIGWLKEQKRVHLAIDAYAAARKRGLVRMLRIVGDGPERSALEHHARHLGLGAESVQFTGEVAPMAVPRLLATASCCLMPAQDEGFGLAAAEALMQGVPVIACTDGGGLRDIVPDAGAGRLCAPDAVEIASALLSVQDDPAAGSAARLLGTEWRSRLMPATVADRVLTWYERALHG